MVSTLAVAGGIGQDQCQGQAQGQLQGQLQGQAQGQAQAAISKSTAMAGAAAIQGQSINDKNKQSTDIKEGDTDYLSIAYADAAANPAQGSESFKLGSFLGGISYTEMNMVTRLTAEINILNSIGELTEADKIEIKENIKRVAKPVKWLFLVKVSGRRHLGNLWGLLLT